MKQQKIYTLIILFTTFALFWENEKVLSSSVIEAATTINANDWLKDNYMRLKHQGIDSLMTELTDHIDHWATAMQSVRQ